MKFRISLLILLISSLYAYSLDFFDKKKPEVLIEELIENMSPEEKIGQLFILGYKGELPDKFILEKIEKNKLGGVKIFGWNGKDTTKVAQSVNILQKKAAKNRFKIPLFIATDQEGGWIRHIKGETSITPGNLAIGASKLRNDAYYSGYFISLELKAIGVNLNFAPTVDLFLNEKSTIIANRTFSSDPKLTAELSVAFLKGQEKNRVISTAKHYPGHGSATGDSHSMMPIIRKSFKELDNNDLVPFKYLIKENIPAIMSGHLNYPLIENKKTSASLSDFFIKNLLRETLNYNGLIITDDLQMLGAKKEGYSNENLAIAAIKSGNDIILSSDEYYNFDIYTKKLINEYNKNKDFQKTINECLKRILYTKIKYIKDKNGVPIYPKIKNISSSMKTKESQDFFLNLAGRAVTKIKLEKIIDDKSSVLLASSYNLFLDEAKNFYEDSKQVYIPSFSKNINQYTLRNSILKEANKDVNNREIIVHVTDEETALLARELLKYRKITVISSLNPSYINRLKASKNIIAIYGIDKYSYKVCFSALANKVNTYGEIPIKGYR